MLSGNSNEEKLHYESLIKLFKFALSLFSGFGIIIGYIIYSDGKELRDNFKEQRSEMKEEINDLKAELKSKKEEMNLDVQDLIKKTNIEIEQSKKDAILQIKSIKNSATNIAKEEARKSIDRVLNANNFTDFVSNVAKEKMEPQIDNIVSNKIKEINRKQLEIAMINIRSNDKIKIIKGFQIIQLSPEIELSEDNIKQIVDIARTGDEFIKQNSLAILLYQNSNEAANFFIEELKHPTNNSLYQASAIQFFQLHNIRYDFFSSFILEKMKKGDTASNVFYNIINQGKSLNEDFTLRVLNDKTLVDYLYSKISNEQFIKDRDALYADYKTTISEKKLKSTYYFNKK